MGIDFFASRGDDKKPQFEISMTEILHSIPENPLPAVHMAGTFRSHDGLELRYALFKANTSPPKGTVVLAQGRNESIEKYAETIKELNAAGLWVAAFDWRGQGGSSRLLKNRRLGHVRRFSDYERDLDTFFEQVVLPDTKLPFFLVGHSMGGLIALSSASRIANRVERIVVSAPFLGLASTKPSPGFVRLVARLMCVIGLGGRASRQDRDYSRFEGNTLTSDPARFARNQALLAAYPDLALGPPTWRWLHECLKAGRRVTKPAYLQSIVVPTVVLGATQDKVASYPEIERMSRYFRAGRLIPINGAEHELFQEADKYRAQAIAALLAFIPGGFSDPMKLVEEEAAPEDAAS
jgi:lysophospholipase